MKKLSLINLRKFQAFILPFLYQPYLRLTHIVEEVKIFFTEEF